MDNSSIYDFTKRIYNSIIDVIYPPACPICSNPLPVVNGSRLDICIGCKGKLSYIKSPRCMKCGKPVEQEETEYCYDCSRVQHEYTQGVSVWVYTDEIKNSIYRFKYSNRREYAQFYGSQIYSNCGHIIRNWNADVIVPVPLHSSKLRKRGYNQAEIIAEQISGLFQIPMDTQLLIREKKTVPQKELNDKERVKNVKNAFKIRKNVVKYRKVILVDDIYTTGTTIDACARELHDIGVKDIYYVSLCIGRGF